MFLHASTSRAARVAALGCVAAALVLATGCAADSPADGVREYAFWPPFPNKPRVQFLTSFEFSHELRKSRSRWEELIYGKELEATLQLNKPYGVAMHDGRIYVCDSRNVAVTVIDPARQEMRVFGISGTGKLVKPVAIAIAPDGVKYVVDTGRSGIVVYDARDRHVALFSRPDFRPVAVAVRGDLLYACEFGKHRIEVLDRHTGQLVRTIGEPGREAGQLAGPLGIALDEEGNVYVTEVFTCRVQKFDPTGKHLLTFGAQGDRPGTFTRPKHLAIDRQGIVYVVENAFQVVQMFDARGRLLMDFGGTGEFPGSMDLPAGICVSETGLELFRNLVHPAFAAERLIIVTNQFGANKVAVYAFGREREGMTVGATISVTPTTQAERLDRPDTQPSETQR